MGIQGESYTEKMARLDKVKCNALSRGQYEVYAQACDEMGVEPDNVESYNLGKKYIAEALQQRNAQKPERYKNLVALIEKEQKKRDNREFVREARQVHPNNISDYPNQKRGLLEQYFPIRFGKGGKQDISKYSPAEIGALFKNVYGSYAE